jgi:phosphotransferase system enzyme I (PtsI)
MGPVALIGQAVGSRAHSGSAERERSDLDSAIEKAIADIRRLQRKAVGEAAEILAFQIAMLEDEALRQPAMMDIEGGAAADVAWRKALDAEIIGYELSDDDDFRARAADLRDIRDRVLRNLSGEAGPLARGGAIVAGEDMPPSLFLEIDWTSGGAIALTRGSASSHVAMLARARGVPMVVGMGEVAWAPGSFAILSGDDGLLILNPGQAVREHWRGRLAELAVQRDLERQVLSKPARLSDGTRLELLVNIASLSDLDAVDAANCDGIGLMRSEFLFRDGAPLPDEETQYQAYRRLLEWADGRPVTVRTLDVGGDKPVAGLTVPGETNPFLGLRGVRLSLTRPDVFHTQLRALARAAVHGNLKVMLPMVTVPQEIREASQAMDACLAALADEGRRARRPPLGIMVEVPAVAITPERFTAAEFLSIGSNDLTQYVTAAARDDPAVAGLVDPADPAVMTLIEGVARFGERAGIPVSLCGDMASDTRCLAALVAAGLRSLSVAPARLAAVKFALSSL